MNLSKTVQSLITTIQTRKSCSRRLACRWLAMVLNGASMRAQIITAVYRMLDDD